MTTKDIRTLDINDFKHDSHLLEYVDENIVILNEVDSNIDNEEEFRLDCLLMMFCIEGEALININGKTFTLQTDHCAILLPNTFIRRAAKPEHCNVRIIAISAGFLKGITTLNKEAWNIGFYLYHNPIFPINRETTYKFYLYKELVLASISEQPRPFLKEEKKHLFSAILCEMLSRLYKDLPTTGRNIEFRKDRSVYIFRKFIELVTADDGTHRSVSYYAEKLCYSPKHISTVVKKISGKAPLTIINEHAMERIKYELKHSDKSMKEIADMFEFSNPSFFGKFVKQHLGISPQQYRNIE